MLYCQSWKEYMVLLLTKTLSKAACLFLVPWRECLDIPSVVAICRWQCLCMISIILTPFFKFKSSMRKITENSSLRLQNLWVLLEICMCIVVFDFIWKVKWLIWITQLYICNFLKTFAMSIVQMTLHRWIMNIYNQWMYTSIKHA